jgi:hypothetical protein
MDSRASNTMFVSRDVFMEYKSVTSRKGDSAKADNGGFKIVGEGNVVQHYQVDGKEWEITYTCALHTPTLNANLVSISALDNAGLTITFGNEKEAARKVDGTIVLTGQNINGMYLLEMVDNSPDISLAMSSLSQPTSLEQWHPWLTHCSPLTIKEMVNDNLVGGLTISKTTVNRKGESCILGHQTHHPFDGETEKDLAPLDLVAFDLWGLSHVQSVREKTYMIVIVDAGTSYKHGVYLPDKSDATTISAFNDFCTRAETMTGRKIRRLWTDRAYESIAWKEYCQRHGITHEFTAPYSSAQNGLAKCAVRTTIDDVHTLLNNSNLSHSYCAEAAAYSIDTHNVIPSRQHPGQIPTKSFTGKRQNITHLHVFGAKCWAKVPTALGGSKLDPRSIECWLLGYASGNRNYKVQEVVSQRVFISHDVVFEEGQPRCTSTGVGEQIPLFNMNIVQSSPADTTVPAINDPLILDQTNNLDITNQINHQPDTSFKPRWSTRVPKPSKASLHLIEYQRHEAVGKGKRKDWATNGECSRSSIAVTIDCPEDHKNVIVCLSETKALHHIPRSYKHVMVTDPE